MLFGRFLLKFDHFVNLSKVMEQFSVYYEFNQEKILNFFENVYSI